MQILLLSFSLFMFDATTQENDILKVFLCVK